MNVGVIAIDGSKLSANASQECSYEYERIVRELLAEADRIDREEDEQHGESRGDELPEHLRTEEGRRAALAQARERLERELADGGSEDGEEDDSDPGSPDLEIELDAVAIVAGQNGRQGWFREGAARWSASVSWRPDRSVAPARSGCWTRSCGCSRTSPRWCSRMSAMRSTGRRGG